MTWELVGRVRLVQRPSLLTLSNMWSNESPASRRPGRSVRLLTLSAAAGAALGLSACSVASAPQEPSAKPVELRAGPAKFSSDEQRTGDLVTLSLTVTNTGENPAPNLAVTLSGLEESEEPMQGLEGEQLESRSRPSLNHRAPWFVDSGPGGTALGGGFTFNAGPLPAGAKRTLRWELAARVPGVHAITYKISSGLTDNAARATSGTGLSGRVEATITES